jgi:hypothetical protein
MGADSSTLQSIESLNGTLNDIERKLFLVEDAHLHHDQTIARDDSIVVYSKSIACRSNVNLIVGPVLGSISTDSCRVLVETDQDASLTLNVFEQIKSLNQCTFVATYTFSAKKGVPVATTVRGLLAGSSYVMYIGGIQCSQALTSYATFHTLSSQFAPFPDKYQGQDILSSPLPPSSSSLPRSCSGALVWEL